VRFVEDDWENPTLGCWGLGWEVWLNGMEVTQFTYFQQVGGIDCKPITGEITYGLERLAMYLQGVDNVYDLQWTEGLSYRDVYHQNEVEQSTYNFEHSDVDFLLQAFAAHERQSQHLMEQQLALPAYEQLLKAGHSFNLLDARGAISVTERAAYIGRIRNLARAWRRATWTAARGWASRWRRAPGPTRCWRKSPSRPRRRPEHEQHEEPAGGTLRRRAAAQGAEEAGRSLRHAAGRRAEGAGPGGCQCRGRPLPRRAGWRACHAVCRQGARQGAAAEADAGGRGAGRQRPAHAGAAEEAGRAGRRCQRACRSSSAQPDGKAEALFLDSTLPGATLAEGLQKALDEAVAKLPIPKVMQYQLEQGRRPASSPAGPA
jgi:hypothetical protein